MKLTSHPHGQEQKTAVISGGSSGIGLECARILSARGYQVTLLARDPARLDSARRSILESTGVEVAISVLDVANADECAQAVAHIVRVRGKIDWLITCAGMVEPGMFEHLSLDSHRRQMETNYFGTLNLVHPTTKVMASAGGGRITLIASGAAFVGVAGYSAYAPGKFAVRALGEVLRVELAPHGISVSVAFPPDTATPQLESEKRHRPEITRQIASGGGVLSPGRVAVRLIGDAEAGRFMLTPSLLMTAFGWLHSLYAPFFRRKQIQLLRKLDEK